ncbi:aminotransferase class V-fold PLP-dependent enzyme [Sphingomonas sp. H39-1-10]|uniref:cysteine desulfurase family protein n=1 Tax=Sphingomonas pollutisoli TaxID=3030829 RepID=UPI0023B9D72B|nr:aminotransferase class V-fold PLP-dependent enzyme [Sphingomonas pollutisoli]MDF0489556.1 aminotransferase class V-fold PLP-dependent enzyme [Sphingomonas pollutisoli]
MADRLYLDHAATTPMPEAARAAVVEGMAGWANPSSPHAEGRAARAALERARGQIAAAYGWRGETLLTSGASEALAIALGRSAPARRLIGATEHDAAIRAAPGATTIPVTADGLVDHAALTALLTSPALVAVQWANSETGVRQPIAEIAAIVHAAGGLLLVDAAQMPGGADPELAEHADFIAISAHKRGGPPGTGALLVRNLATLTPVGGQERGYRAGTENLPGALGHAAALAVPEPVSHYAALRERLDDAITRSGGDVVASAAPRHPAIGSYRMRGLAAATQLVRFDMAGIAVSAGSACSSGSMKPSHVLTAMGWTGEATREVIRVSFGRATTAEDVDRFVAAWRDIARGVRAFAA